MKRLLIILPFYFASIAQAGEIFKCEVNGQIRYVQSKIHCENSQAADVKYNIEKKIANKQQNDTELKKSEVWLKQYAVRKKQSDAKNKLYQQTHENWLKTAEQAEEAQSKADQNQDEWKYCVSKNTRLLKQNQKNCRVNPKLQREADYLKAKAEGYEKALAKI